LAQVQGEFATDGKAEDEGKGDVEDGVEEEETEKGLIDDPKDEEDEAGWGGRRGRSARISEFSSVEAVIIIGVVVLKSDDMVAVCGCLTSTRPSMAGTGSSACVRVWNVRERRELPSAAAADPRTEPCAIDTVGGGRC
jgi:hypothetical protein